MSHDSPSGKLILLAYTSLPPTNSHSAERHFLQEMRNMIVFRCALSDVIIARLELPDSATSNRALPTICMLLLANWNKHAFLAQEQSFTNSTSMHQLNLLRELNRLQTSLVGETKDYFAILSTVFFKLTSASVFCGSIRNDSLKSKLAFS